MITEEIAPPRYDYLDSTRGLASLSVLLSHFIGAYSIFPASAYVNNFIFHSLWNGEGAVYYFYLLSGYVLSIAFFDKRRSIKNLNIGGFIVQRVFRIYPLFIICLLISFVLQKIYVDCPSLETFPERSAWICSFWHGSRTIADLLKESILLILIPPASELRLLPQDWTLSIEIWFSIVIPIFVLTFTRSTLWFCTLICFVFYLSPMVLPFGLGILLAKFTSELSKQVGERSVWIKGGLILLGLLFYSGPLDILSPITLNHPSRALLFESTGAAILLLSLIGSHTFKKILSMPFLVFLGKISYGIYLTHFFILLGIIPWSTRFMNRLSIENEYITQVLALLLFVILTVGLSYLLYELIETPFKSFGKRISAKYFYNQLENLEV